MYVGQTIDKKSQVITYLMKILTCNFYNGKKVDMKMTFLFFMNKNSDNKIKKIKREREKSFFSVFSDNSRKYFPTGHLRNELRNPQ
jgi:hypothetical protein